MRPAVWSLLFAPVLALAASFFACSLGLDESLLSKARDGGPDGPLSPDGVAPITKTCSIDAECMGSNACVTGRCDPNRHQCTYALCPTNSDCSAAACDTATFRCGDPAPVRFEAGSFGVELGSSCGSGDKCFAAAFPYFFVIGPSGVVAYSLANPNAASPPKVQVSGITFTPSLVVASGARVYFIGNPIASTPSKKLPVAWIDVPADPLVPRLVVTSVQALVPNIAGISMATATGDGGIILVAAPGLYAQFNAPVEEGARLDFASLEGVPMNAAFLGASGSRYVLFRTDPTTPYSSRLSFENNVGTPSSSNSGETDVTADLGRVGPTGFTVQQGGDGSLLWCAPAVTTVPAMNPMDAGSPTPAADYTTTARLTWIVEAANASKFSPKVHVDIAAYPLGPPAGYPPGASVCGPIAPLDAKSAIALALVTNDGGTSSRVTLATKDSPMPDAVKTVDLPVDFAHVWATSSNGYGYVVTNAGGAFKVHTFAARCGK